MIYIANNSTMKSGGGWSFIANFIKAMGDQITYDYEKADVFFIPSASMIKPEIAEKAWDDGKKVILRVDNALKHSRNGGKGMARMKRMAEIADAIVYQCQWSRDYLGDYLGGQKKSTVIYNGVDTDIFNTKGKIDAPSKYLYSCAAKGETKRWEWVWWKYQQIQKKQPNAELTVTGNLSTPVLENNLDFFQGEKYKFYGMITDPDTMADFYRNHNYFFAVYENDCYSNTYLEALACGMELIEVNMTGGTPELLSNWAKGIEYNGLKRMEDDWMTLLKVL